MTWCVGVFESSHCSDTPSLQDSSVSAGESSFRLTKDLMEKLMLKIMNAFPS